MKNILKRGTSLLLVVAMLLSFAVVVGATELASKDARVKIWADTTAVSLSAGQNVYVPIYTNITEGYGIGAMQFSVYCDPGITLVDVTNTMPYIDAEGEEAERTSAMGKGKDKVFTSSNVDEQSNTTLDWFRVAWSNTEALRTDIATCWAVVRADNSTSAGGYGIHIIPFDNDRTYSLFSVATINGEPVSGNIEPHYIEDVTVEDGAAIVYNESELPMVALTKTTFDVPTMEDWRANKDGSHDLSKYLKIVAKVGDDVVLYEPETLSVNDLQIDPTTDATTKTYVDGKNYLQIPPQNAVAGSASMTIKVAKAKGNADVAVTDQTISYTIRKTRTDEFWKSSFAKTDGTYVSQKDFLNERDFPGGAISAPNYVNGNATKTVWLNTAAFDVYGTKISTPAYYEIELYSDGTYAEAKKLAADDSAYTHVTIGKVGETQALNYKTLLISKDLEKDVYCKVRTYVLDAQNNKVYGEEASFLIKSTKPYAAGISIKLKNSADKELTDTNFTIPTGNETLQIKIVPTVNSQFGTPLDVQPKVTVTASCGGTTFGSDLTNGVKLENNVLTITSDAWKQMASTENSMTITIKATVTNDASLVATETITLTKAQPVAASIGSYDSETQKYEEGKIYADSSNVLPTLLPWPGDQGTQYVVLAPVYVLDQYGDPVKENNISETVPAANFKVYPATKDEASGKWVKKEGAEAVDAKYATFEDGTDSCVKLTLTNAKKGDNGVELEAGSYIIEATYNDQKMAAVTAAFTLTRAASTYSAEVENPKTLYVPYKYGSLGDGKASTTSLFVSIRDQYNATIAAGSIKYVLSGFNLGGKAVDPADNAVTADNDGKITLGQNAAKYIAAGQTVDLTASMTVVINEGENGEITISNVSVTVPVTREASALKKATVTMYEGPQNDTELAHSTLVTTKTLSDTEETINMISPKTAVSYRFVISGEDQYGDKVEGLKVTEAAGTQGEEPVGIYVQPDGERGYRLDLNPGAKGPYYITTNVNNYRFYVRVSPMQFVTTVDGNTEIQAKDMLNDSNIPGTYNGSTWDSILTAAKTTQTVYIKNEGEGNNTEVEAGSISWKVVSVDADGHETEITDTSAKADAGSYKIKVIYTKDGQTYDVCETETFTINKKPITIGFSTADGKIEKPYDGDATLPEGVELMPEGLVGNDRVIIDTSALKFAQKDVKLKDDGTVDSIAIQLVEGKDCLQLPGENVNEKFGGPATNYTVELEDGNVKGLTGTINKRTIVVTPKSSDEVNLTYGADVAEKLASEYTTNIDALPTTCVKPTIEGSMALIKDTAEASAPYDAGEYTVALGNLSLTGTSAGNYEIQFTTGVQWTISQKTVEKFDAETLNDSYGVRLNDLYTKLMKMTVVENGAESLKVSDLYDIRKLTIGNLSRVDALVNAGDYEVTGWQQAKKAGTNYNVQNPHVTVKIAKHALSANDIHITSGEFTYNGAAQTCVFDVSFTYYTTPISLVEGRDYEITANTNSATNAGTYTLIITGKGDNFTGSASVNWKISLFTIERGDLSFQSTSDFTYDGQPKQLQKDNITWTVTTTDETRKAVLNSFAVSYVNSLEYTDAGTYTARVVPGSNFTTGDGVYFDVPWTIKKSNEKPIGDQTANTKYGQPGSIEIAVPTGAAKGLATSNLSVSALTDNDQIVDGTPSATFENGKIVVNWKLRGDATTIGKSATLRVTVAKSDNYKEYSFGITVTAAKKDAQDKFYIATEDGRSSYSYSEAGVRMNVSGNKTDVTWSIDPSYQEYAEIIDGSYVKFKKPGTVTVKATAKETNDYAAAERTYTLTITKGQVTVSASSATMTANDPLPGFSATASGLNPKDSVSDVFQTLTATVSTDGKTAGTYRVTPNAVLKAGWDAYYDLSFVQGTLTVNPAASVIDTILPTIIAGNGCANSYADCSCEIFYDLDASRWYHEAIDWAYNLGLMNGTTKSTFGPNAAATRAQTWTMLARIAGQDTRRSSTWYEVGQKWAMGLGITDGTNPMGTLTREQLAAMLYRYVGSPAVNGTLTFSDSANVSTWAKDAMVWAVQNGILDGVGGNRLNPKGTTTRAQAAAIFMRFSKLINK